MKQSKPTTRQAELIFEKVVYQGDTCFKLTSINNILKQSQLPYNYIHSGFPYFYQTDDPRVIFYKSDKHTSSWQVMIGDILTQSSLNDLIKTFKAAGERLTVENKRLKALESSWKGEVSITI